MMERTLSIIKPDAVRRNLIGPIVAMMEKAGFTVAGMKLIHMTAKQAEGFYAEHQGKPFFGELVEFMSSGPCVVLVLEAEDVITRYRELMGATNPAKAAEGTIRKTFAVSFTENSVHGSDSPQSAAREISYFFNALEQVR